MYKLINGKGQIGSMLKENSLIDATIYHTWNFLDKSEETQKECYRTFIRYVENHKDEYIIFISTKSTSLDFYTSYKRKAEEYLARESKDYLIIRLPNIIGRGVCAKFKSFDSEAFGDIELLTIEDTCKEIEMIIEKDNRNIIIEIQGEIVSAKMVKNLIQFGMEWD